MLPCSRFRIPTWSALLAAAGLFLAARPAAAQPGVDEQFCNITGDGGAPFAQCEVGLIGGIPIGALRQNIVALPTGDGVALFGMTIAGIPIEIPAPATVEARFSDPQPLACIVIPDKSIGEVCALL